MFIYKIINLVNFKIYIGQTLKSVSRRARTHLNSLNTKSNRPLYNAINKYGKENFVIIEIDKASTKEELNNKEIYYIAYYKATDRNYGYNLSIGGQTNIMSEDGRKRFSIASKKMWADPGFKVMMKEKLSSAPRVRVAPYPKHSEESKLKISKNRKNKSCGENHHNFGKPGFMLGKKFNNDHKNKISKALKGNKNGKEGRDHHMSIRVMCIETGEIFESICQANKKYKGKIYRAIRNNRTAAGFHWKIMEK
jgi:group I intron endonuclease